ncbi:hypothetical protein B0H19DRAFT_1277068 [Mycena capillaripes]|nr:hypothetical protein B0H19DRAFT_1277068 [Mycena capillaripes]
MLPDGALKTRSKGTPAVFPIIRSILPPSPSLCCAESSVPVFSISWSHLSKSPQVQHAANEAQTTPIQTATAFSHWLLGVRYDIFQAPDPGLQQGHRQILQQLPEDLSGVGCKPFARPPPIKILWPFKNSMRKTSSASDARIWMASESSLLGFTLPIDLKEFADGSLLCRSIRIPVDKMEHKRLFGDPVAFPEAPVQELQGSWIVPSTSYTLHGGAFERADNQTILDTNTIDDDAVSKIYGTIKGTNFDSNKCGWIYPASSTVKSLVFAIGNTMYTVSYVRFRPMIFTYIGVMFAAECGGLPIRILGDIFLKSVCSVLN